MVKKILIVDDEPDILKSVRMVLERMGYKVTAVESGKKALQCLQKEKFDVVLLDMLMPEMSGNEVAERIRKNPALKNQKIIFLTVVTLGEAGKSWLPTLKPAAYIQKPFDIGAFKKKIKEVIGA